MPAHQPPVDLRGDSSAPPTAAMRHAMHDAPAGGYGDDDPSIIALQRHCAEMFGKDEGLFVPTVTMANLIVVMHACRPGEQVIVDADAHLYRNELGGMTRLAGAMPQVVARDAAAPDLAGVAERLAHPGVHADPVRLVWAENTHEAGGGAVIAPDRLTALGDLARAGGARLGVDGARIFNAAARLDVSPEQLCAGADSVAIGLTKALAVPAGAVLVGDRDLIDHAKHLRRLLGGNIKKAGPFAAAALSAIANDLPRIHEDHFLAARIGEIVETCTPLRLETPVETNLVRVSTTAALPARECVRILASHGVLVKAHGPHVIRLATHRGLQSEQLPRVRNAFEALAAEIGARPLP